MLQPSLIVINAADFTAVVNIIERYHLLFFEPALGQAGAEQNHVGIGRQPILDQRQL